MITKAVGALEDGEELSDEDLAEIVAKCKAQGKTSANSSVKGKGKDGKGKEDPAPGDDKEISLDQFLRMTITEKSNLYLKQPDVYKQLASEAKAKKKLV